MEGDRIKAVKPDKDIALRLGLLDLGERRPGQDAVERLCETLALAVEAERLGYSRYWLGEHHDLACS